MRRTGCEAIKWGVETGDPDILRRLRKGTTLEQVRHILRVCRELGIRSHATFTIGLPGETPDTIRRTRDLMLELAPDSAQISLTTPFPGTDMYDASSTGRADTDWQHFDGARHAVGGPDGMSPQDLEAALAELQSAWQAFARQREGWVRRLFRAAAARLRA